MIRFYDRLFFGELAMMHKSLVKDSKCECLDDYFKLCVKLVDETEVTKHFRKQMWKRASIKIGDEVMVGENIYKITRLGEKTFSSLNENIKYYKITDVCNAKIIMEKIYKRFKATDFERAVFDQYIEYMNDESKMTFLQRVLVKDRDYFKEFCSTDLEDFGNEMFQEKISHNERREQTDMYSLDPRNLLLLYKGTLMRLRTLPKEERRALYENLFAVDLAEFDTLDTPSKRELFANKFINFVTSLSVERQHRFIDDVFDKHTTTDTVFDFV